MSLTFRDLGLSETTLQTLDQLGYEQPSPIQAIAIPPLLAGKDVVGLAQTGTGKTAAFSLPLLERIDLSQRVVQLLVLAPTRELAGQVAEACQNYSAGNHKLKVAALYGGQSFGEQARMLKSGAQIVVGTPGRLLDHLDRGTLRCDQLQAVVLDEADEMLRMGFIDDVEQILATTPAGRQTALFSATMPPQIQAIADNYLNNPERLEVKAATASADTVDQRYWLVRGAAKDTALSRFLELATEDAAMVFTRTKAGAVDVAERLEDNGIGAAALTGDLPQAQREAVVARLKKGLLDVVVATDVAARGLDVDRIALVVNYDLPDEPEQYVHRIGRTGRAGRQGVAISFVHPRQRRLLSAIERHCRLRLQVAEIPTALQINEARQLRWFKRFALAMGMEPGQKVSPPSVESAESSDQVEAPSQPVESQPVDADNVDAVLNALDDETAQESATAQPTAAAPVLPNVDPDCLSLVQGFVTESGVSADQLAASLLHQLNGERALLLDPSQDRPARPDRRDRSERGAGGERGGREGSRDDRGRPAEVQSYRFAVGRSGGVRPGHIVGAIANELGIPGAAIGPIDINDKSCIVGLPKDLAPSLISRLKRLYINGVAGDAEPVEHRYGGHRKPRGDRPRRRSRDRRQSSKPRY